MTELTPASKHSLSGSLALAAGIALSFAILLYLLTGPTLGLFFGGVVIVTILLPPLSLIERDLPRQGLIASTVCDSVGLVWLIGMLSSETTLLQWFRCYLLLASYSFALWGLICALNSLRVPAIPASALTVTIGMLWLSWPVWLARFIVRPGNDALVSWLAPPHPLLALNGVLKHLGIWSEHPIAYNHLLNLGQDVAYALPTNVLTPVIVHLIAGGLLFAVSLLRH